MQIRSLLKIWSIGARRLHINVAVLDMPGIQVTFEPTFITPDSMQYSDNPNDSVQESLDATTETLATKMPEKNTISIVDIGAPDSTAAGDGSGTGDASATAKKKRKKHSGGAPKGVSFDILGSIGSTSASVVSPDASEPSLVAQAIDEISGLVQV